MPTQKIEINLLAKEHLEKTPFGKFLKWALLYGRYIIIGTEIIVLLAFLSRFKLDRDLTDYSDSIKTKQAVIEASADLENNVRALQARLAKISDLEGKQVPYENILTLLSPLVPPEVIFTDFAILGAKVNLSGQASSLNSFATFLTNLTSSGYFKEISLEKLAEEETGGLTFTLTTRFVKKGGE